MEKLFQIYKKWCTIPDKIRFVFVGGYNCAFSYLIFALAVYLIGKEHYQLCVALQWCISSVFSYLNQKIFVFCTKGHWFKEYFKCCATWSVSYLCNAFVIEIVLKYLIKNVYLAQLLSVMLSAIVTYILFKHFAFKHKEIYESESLK